MLRRMPVNTVLDGGTGFGLFYTQMLGKGFQKRMKTVKDRQILMAADDESRR